MAKIIELKSKISFLLYPKPPYSFDATIHKPSHFPSSDNEWAEGRYWITMLWQDKILGLRLEDKGIRAKPKIKVTVYSEKLLSKDFVASLIPELKYRFNTESDIFEFIKVPLPPYIRHKGRKCLI